MAQVTENPGIDELMERLVRRLTRNNCLIKITSSEKCSGELLTSRYRKHTHFSIKTIGKDFIAIAVHEGQAFKVTARRTIPRGKFKKAFQEAFDYAI